MLAKHLSDKLLGELLLSENFVVMQVEMDIYNFLKIWLYYRIHPACDFCLKKLVIETQKYFQSEKAINENTTFLLTDKGKPYIPVFKCLRLKNLLGDLKCIKLLEKDSIIPKGKEFYIIFIDHYWKNRRNYTRISVKVKIIVFKVFFRYDISSKFSLFFPEYYEAILLSKNLRLPALRVIWNLRRCSSVPWNRRLLLGYSKILSNFSSPSRQYKTITVCRCKQNTSKRFQTFLYCIYLFKFMIYRLLCC